MSSVVLMKADSTLYSLIHTYNLPVYQEARTLTFYVPFGIAINAPFEVRRKISSFLLKDGQKTANVRR
jgi:hypothetical protein